MKNDIQKTIEENIKLKIIRLEIDLNKNDVYISRTGNTDEALYAVLHNGDIEIYIEYYYDGDIALVVSDRKNKKILEAVDLYEEEVLPTILKYYK